MTSSGTWAFVVASVILLLIPGPGVIYVVTRSSREGFGVGVASVLGLHLGTLFHVFVAALGVSAFVRDSLVAYRALALIGGLYLIWLGYKAIRDNKATQAGSQPVLFDAAIARRRAFADGIVVNVLNPKIAVFFVAFAPQFLRAEEVTAANMVTLGLIFVALGVVCDGLYAALSHGMSQVLLSGESAMNRAAVIAACAYFLLGVSTIASAVAKH